MPDSAKLRSQLLETYQKLPSLEKVIVQLASVIYAPTNRDDFLRCLRAVVREEFLKQLSPIGFRAIFDRLIKINLLARSGILGNQSNPGNQGISCHPLMVEIATREAIKSGTFGVMATKVNAELPIATGYRKDVRRFGSFEQFLREVRIGIYQQDLAFVHKQIQDFLTFASAKEKIDFADLLLLVCDNPFDAQWFSNLAPDFYEPAMAAILERSMAKLTNSDAAMTLLEAKLTSPENQNHNSEFLQGLWAQQLLFRGYVQTAQMHIQQNPQILNSELLWGWSKFLVGENVEAIADLTKALTKKSKQNHAFATVILILALLKAGDNLVLAEQYASSRQFSQAQPGISYRLKALILFLQGDQSQKAYFANEITLERLSYQVEHHDFGSSLEVLITCLCIFWVDADLAKARLPKILVKFCRQAETAGYKWIALQTEHLLLRLGQSLSTNSAPIIPAIRHQSLPQEERLVALVDIIRCQESWEISLNALVRLQSAADSKSAKSNEGFRLAWFVSFRHQNGWAIQPKEQKISAKGLWSNGRNIALKRLKKSEIAYLSDLDLKVCAEIEPTSDYSYGQGEYEFGEKAIVALIDHPLVFWEDSPNIRVEVVKGEPELLVLDGKQDRIVLEFMPPIDENQEIVVTKVSPTKLKVIAISPEHHRIAAILGTNQRLEVPVSAKEKVLSAINAIAKILTVHSDIGGGADAEEVAALATPHIHLLPAGNGLKVAVLVRPFAQIGSYYQSGKGGETVIAEIDGTRWQTTRDLNLEQELSVQIIERCPTLAAQVLTDGECIIADPETCLELILELQELGDLAIIEWLQGQKFKIRRQSGLGDLRLTIQRQNNWFAAGGELKLDDDEVMDMQRLMASMRQTSSRFIPLGDGEFLALTLALRQQLDILHSYSEKFGNDGLRFHPLAALALEDFVDAAGEVEADEHWQEHIRRLKEMKDLQPEVPKTLHAELRDYQIEGFSWMAKLAHWGVGACLADDMGLGKTLQALALILSCGHGGPTLVIAPTSVCLNWVSEAEKFAPSLNILQMANLDKNRQSKIDQLQPFDLLICSYGLLQQDSVAEMLAQVHWQVVVLDEAQWIKNFATKRSKGAMQLQAQFKLITTGTPIENHLGELWNLFRFINPGLLGTLEKFNQEFANPIERFQDQPAQARLRKLIQPFILRRTKSQVLQELPPRTDILLHVDFSQEELALYEALRREAITKLTNSDAKGGAKHLQILTEIMKLRRMCCNPQLVMPESAISSSKLQLFSEVVSELLENQHKALVFSQFVDHLHIIRDYLDRQNITYQYLDGSTPAKERQKRVDAFQSGQGDIFLISLKAGGIGLNLTAADYVIHMDPWWNPAVEDQASDRAHRIGQQRPVTIYRLVTRNTIEAKIVDLHQHKRDLADSLLEGSDSSSKVSADELLRLITSQ